MGCSACEKRRRMLKVLKDKKKLKGQQVQAAAIGAVLAVSEAAGKLIHGEVEDGQVVGIGDEERKPDNG